MSIPTLVPFPQIQIRQQYAKLGIEAQRGMQDIRQPQATLDLRQVPTRLDIRHATGIMNIDQSDAWDALGRGGTLKTMSRIYSQGQSFAMEGIARRVEDGNRLAAIQVPGNTVGAIVSAHAGEEHPLNVVGAASTLNVHFYYDLNPAQFSAQQGGVVNNSHDNKPELNYYRGKVNVYLTQRDKVEITPPQIDMGR